MTVQLKDGFYHVAIDKAVLVLTKAELLRALRRGKWWKRHTALAQRQATLDTAATHGDRRDR
jgi:hypothetical protein